MREIEKAILEFENAVKSLCLRSSGFFQTTEEKIHNAEMTKDHYETQLVKMYETQQAQLSDIRRIFDGLSDQPSNEAILHAMSEIKSVVYDDAG